VKKVHAMLEEAKTVVRQVRREANEAVRQMEKDGDLSEDDARRYLEDVQKATDRHVKDLDTLSAGKEKDLLEV
jgi:ribosome recycling factor